MKIKIASIGNYLAAALLMVMGIIYLTKTSFMYYHSEAVSLDWNEVESNIQVLILALMKAVSGGLITGSITIMYLQFKFTTTRLSWIPVLILIIGIVLSGTILYAMLIVKLKTPGSPPFFLTISGTVLLIIGYIFNMSYIKDKN